jgi:hypothetical protein
MLKFIAKPSVILSWVLISCLSVHISFADHAFALRPPADLVTVAASDQGKREYAEIQATSAVPKDKAKTPVPEEKTMTVLQGGGRGKQRQKSPGRRTEYHGGSPGASGGVRTILEGWRS